MTRQVTSVSATVESRRNVTESRASVGSADIGAGYRCVVHVEAGAMDGFEEHDAGDEGSPEPRRRVRTSTVVVVVAAGWLLLTLFLVGRFSRDDDRPLQANLDASSGLDAGDGGGGDDKTGAGEEEVAADGEVTANGGGGPERTVASGSATEASVVDGGAPATGGGPSGGGAGGGSGSGTGSGAATAGPAAGGTGGGSTGNAPTTTAKGSAPPTTKAPSPTATSTTSKPPASTTTTTAAPVTVQVTATNLFYGYPAGYDSDFSVPAGSRVRFDNTEPDGDIEHTFTISGGWDSGDLKAAGSPRTSPALTAKGTFEYSCKHHPVTMHGAITVT
jgi:plastocyanin